MTPQRLLAQLNLLDIWKHRMQVWGSCIGTPTFDRTLYIALHRLGWMGGEQKTFLEQTIRPGMHVLDIGANLGLYTLLLSRLVGPAGIVTAIEPDPQLFEALQANCSANSALNVRFHNVAAGSCPGGKLLFRSLLHSGDNRLSSPERLGFREPVEVRVARVDELVGDDPVDFVKIDTQGWESEVLAGMQRVLARPSMLQIWFEYWPSGLRAAGSDPIGLLTTLTRMGFSLYQPMGRNASPISDFADIRLSTIFKYTDLHAVRNPTAH